MMFRSLCVLGLWLLSSCGYRSADDLMRSDANEIYDYAEARFAAKDWSNAAIGYESLERRYPFDSRSQSALLKAMEAHLADESYVDLGAVADKYLKLYPVSNYHDQVLYYLGYSYYAMVYDTDRGANEIIQAEKQFSALVQRYPQSKYSVEASRKLVLLREYLAGYAMKIGRELQRQKKWSSSIGYYQQVVNDYPKTDHAREALYRLVEVFYALGDEAAAKRHLKVLELNAYESEWYKKGYNLLAK